MSERIDYQQIIDETKRLLKDNSAEWRKRYEDYAVNILENVGFIKSARQEFKLTPALSAYINVSNAKRAKKVVTFELRHLGQSVAKLISCADGITIDTSGFDEKNKRDFDCEIKLSESDWRSPKADGFRSFFHNRKPIRLHGSPKKNEEHRLESLLLAEFSKGTEKALPNIQPVKIEGLRFPMPTPLSASDHNKIKYSGSSGGGIDIFTRIGTGGPATHLGIIELKDENKKAEPASEVIKQALIYATFIRELLRSEAGENWWKLFGFSGSIPKKLLLYSICAMPDIEGADTSFGEAPYDIEGDTIQLHYIYFKEKDNQIENIRTSLLNKAKKI